MVKILAVTEYFNEAENIPGLVENVMAQSITPEYWILVDDGSTDDSTRIFKESLKKYGIPFSVTYGEKKDHPSPNLKGRAFQKVVELNSDWLDQNRFDFLLKLDADTRLPVGYIERAVTLLQDNPQIGCFSGQIEGERSRGMPCGTGKFVRWDVLQLTCGKYWDLDPDTLWNIKAYLHGYKLFVGDDSFTMKTTRPTLLLSKKGSYLMGQRMAYVRCNTLLIITRLVRRIFERNYPLHFLKGYLREWLRFRNRWRSNDPDVRYFYSLKYRWDVWRGRRERI